ncbi:MAG: Re/Si-specific NAD(P)(+) transhydrogenase subunit alpha [Planctomycetota bacterium]|nr:Re/Si-specific NAD(P)(+) transhydrogenase subunit alpha [Planctomycetota bacterium]MDA0931925.1 Re/Si-specific NAD(P)(+) transhydrogenase subunit alpha [Planctomycetota bacterium]MDA1220446.1 Re/Si-specific NAD(P)(+) transhydrogenase subunit alpha [Planctomycetota bacterium]
MALIFVPRETEPGESRVAATPETVKGYTKLGLQVAVESGAGLASGFRDADYEAAGARIGGSLGEADLVLMVRTPQPGAIAGMKRGAVLASGLVPNGQAEAIVALRDAGVTSFGMELIPRITRAQKMDVLSSQATCAGYQAVLLAAASLPRFFPLLMTAAGTIKPAKVFILGAGVAGLQAISTARRLGAVVEANDVRPAVKEQVESLGAKFVDTGTPPDAETSGGYAKEATTEYLDKQRQILTEHVAEADVVITTALIPGRPAPRIVTDAMVQGMRPGSVIVDLAAPNGGNVEGTVPGEVVDRHGVKILGETNLPALCAADASRMWARNVLGFAELLVNEGAIAPHWDDEIVKACCVTRDGEVVHEGARTAVGGGN